LFQTSGTDRQISNVSIVSLLNRQVKFTVSYSDNSIQLRANNILVGVSAPIMKAAHEPVIISIESSDSSKALFLSGVLVSDSRIEDTVSMTPFKRP
jgi:hypothetical protein